MDRESEAEHWRHSYFKYKVLRDAEGARRPSRRTHGCLCRNSCRCPCDLLRAISFAKFCLLFSTSLFLAMAPWAVALMELALVLLLYVLLLRPSRVSIHHFNWRTSEEDVVIFSAIRSVAAVVSFFLGLGHRLQWPYVVMALACAIVGLPYIAFKALLLSRPLLSKWGALLLTAALFSVVHVLVAFNVSLFARRRYQLGLLPQDEEQACLSTGCRGTSDLEVDDLADENSNFIECQGLKIHYRAAFPLEEQDPSRGIILIHGFGGGAFAWRNVIDDLATRTNQRVYAFDRPAFGLTSQLPAVSEVDHLDSRAPYRLAFQASLVLRLCELWGCSTAVLVGHADGALVALRAAATACSVPARQPASGVAGSGVSTLVPKDIKTVTALEEGGTKTVSPQQPCANSVNPFYAEETTSNPSSPFSKWLHLGQPDQPHRLRDQLSKTVRGNPGCVSGTSDIEFEGAFPPSLALGSENAERQTEIAEATYATNDEVDDDHASQAWSSPGACEGESNNASCSTKVSGLALLHPSFGGRVKPQVAQVLSKSRIGRHFLQRLLRSEVGVVSQKRAWHNPLKLTPELLRQYKASLRAEQWDTALVEAYKLRKEASDAELMEDYVAVRRIQKLLLTGLQDRFVSPAVVEELSRQMGDPAEAVIVPSCGHLSHEEAYESLLMHLCALVDRAARAI